MGSTVRAFWTWQYIQTGLQQWAPLCARSEHGNTYRPEYSNGLHCARVLNMAIHTDRTTEMGSTVRAFWTWQYIQARLQQWAPLCARSEHGNTYRPCTTCVSATLCVISISQQPAISDPYVTNLLVFSYTGDGLCLQRGTNWTVIHQSGALQVDRLRHG